jgi:hypothetical protein
MPGNRPLGALIVLASLVAARVESATPSDYTQMSGRDLYTRFCASCHGPSGRGDGPVAEALDVIVPDLSRLSQRNRGRFPVARVAEVIDGRSLPAAHGNRTMPVWGVEFWLEAGADSQAEFATRAIVERLVGYLKTLQPPPAEPQETE